MSKIWFGAIVASALLSLPALASADASVPMAEDTHINDELRAGFVGDAIRKTCPSISARMLVVMERLFSLKAYAERQGYSEADYNAFRKDPAQKARLKAEAQAYLEQAGAKPGDVESYCMVGRDEIAKGTAIGTLLKE